MASTIDAQNVHFYISFQQWDFNHTSAKENWNQGETTNNGRRIGENSNLIFFAIRVYSLSQR